MASLSECTVNRQKVIALVDMDSFECQIYKRMFPNEAFWGRPWVVADKTGRIVSATHEARDLGISRQIRLREARRLARQHNVDLKVFTKPNDREKPDGKEVRYATWDILDSLKKYAATYSNGITIEYSSSDEFYLDITDEVSLRMNDEHFSSIIESRTFLEEKSEKLCGEPLKHAIGSRYRFANSENEQERWLLCGGILMQEVNNFLFRETKLIGSVGVGSNKLMAKLAVSMNKPNGITILPDSALPRVGKNIKIEKIPGFGGAFGTSVKEIFNVTSMAELANIELERLEDIFGEEKGMEVFAKSRGISEEPVKLKLMNNGVSASKNFHGEITSDETLHYHLHQLTEEMLDRLGEERERHKRQPTVIRFFFNYYLKDDKSSDEKLSWTYNSVYERDSTCDMYCNEAINDIFDVKRINIDAINVVKMEVTAKGFLEIQHPFN